jgi:hypothetical protein
MKRIILLSILCCMALLASSQGLLLEDESYTNIPELAPLEGTKDADLPKHVDLSQYCPEVRNQGDIYSCVGWAVGYGALTIKKAIQHQWTDKNKITAQAYSAMFIYNQIKQKSCRDGARITDALNLLQEQGDCLASQFDDDIEDCNRQPSDQLLAQINLDTISDYIAVFGLKATDKTKVSRTIRALARKEPIIVGMAVRQNFYQLHNAKYWWPDIGNTTPAGGHAMVVVGYDLQSGSFLLFNSWGKQWGDKGFIRIKFQHYAKFCKYAFIITSKQLSATESNPHFVTSFPLRTLSGRITFNYLDDATDGINFLSANVTHQENGVYISNRDSWGLGQLFQLAGWAEQQGVYLYVFSVSPSKKANIHWPRVEAWNETYRGKNESPFLLDAQAKAVIPAPDKALRINERGTDRLYVFFASRPIKHFRFIVNKMNKINRDYRTALEELLGKHLIPLTDIHFQTDQLAFEATTRHQGYIAPMILEINAE